MAFDNHEGVVKGRDILSGVCRVVAGKVEDQGSGYTLHHSAVDVAIVPPIIDAASTAAMIFPCGYPDAAKVENGRVAQSTFFSLSGAFGRRTQNATGTNFLYDGVNAVQELTGGSPTANLLEGGVDENFLRTDSAGSWNFLADALGSTVALADANGVMQTQYTYDPYGNTTATGLSTSNPAQYTGRENDATGLYYYRARYYNPTFGRFISEDPLGLEAGPNFFSYVGNNPIIRIDPFGLDWLNNLADFSAGAGSVLSLGMTDYVNDATGASDYINPCSGWHKAGEWTGVGLDTAIGGAEGFEEGVERGAGEEWSHWIPDRIRQGKGGWIPDSIVNSDLNGQYVSDLEHALNDKWRNLKGMTRADKNPAWLQQWNRIPPWVKGAGAGAAYGSAAKALAGRNCGCK